MFILTIPLCINIPKYHSEEKWILTKKAVKDKKNYIQLYSIYI